MPVEDTKKMTNPCGACPFRRSVSPGELGGSPPDVYMGQAYAPMYLPCHRTVDFSDPDWKTKCSGQQQCAGAAIFRSNVGMGKAMPPGIHTLPEDREIVFGDAVEFLSHHAEITKQQASEWYIKVAMAALAAREVMQAKPIG